ncbi:winged helix-turn-helix transcriptional regulator [Chitinophaga japonensis]|uniref:HxlR family transcriptional regulator n=1 Tax=Chitinophaga japonensis TaxID=104662 RepID=A0A562TEZ9_CHIJA|nr:helix-turn-helix domain-containing protein [Chitinophaga japonensis]TWI91560.1 HxlR family transcriptional regulator [Chitinophaga japonensis]
MYGKKTKKIKDDLDCGITVAMRVFGAKWKPCIIDAVYRGYNRPSEIHRQVPEASARVLDIQLSELLELGVVTRETGEGFPLYSVYQLTELGESIVPIVRQLNKWGDTYKEQVREKLAEAYMDME